MKTNGDTDKLVFLSEITLNNLSGDGEYDYKDFLDRADILCDTGHTVMISNCQKHDVLINYLDRCKPQSIGIILGILNIVELFTDKHHKNAAGETLRYFGEIFSRNTRMLVYPYHPDKKKVLITTQNLTVPENLKHLLEYLKTNQFLIDLEGYDVNVMQIFSPKVLQMIKSAEPGWEEMVPETVADMIKERCLFEYPCEISPKS
jgi:hypothetical protein